MNRPAPTVLDAAHLAASAHAQQTDKLGIPYIAHLAVVAYLLGPHGDHAVMAGWLHDAVEDTAITLAKLRELGYPEEVVRAVDSVTRREVDGVKEDYLDLVRRAAADPLGRQVKLADNTHNADPARQKLLPATTRDRLTKKYAEAREILEAAGARL